MCKNGTMLENGIGIMCSVYAMGNNYTIINIAKVYGLQIYGLCELIEMMFMSQEVRHKKQGDRMNEE